jgi:hypothetical protein
VPLFLNNTDSVLLFLGWTKESLLSHNILNGIWLLFRYVEIESFSNGHVYSELKVVIRLILAFPFANAATATNMPPSPEPKI